MIYYALVPIILLGVAAALTFVGGRSRRHMVLTTLVCIGLLILADVIDPGRSGPLSWEWVLMAVVVPSVTAVVISALAGARAALWLQWLVGAGAGFLGVVLCGLLVNALGSR